MQSQDKEENWQHLNYKNHKTVWKADGCYIEHSLFKETIWSKYWQLK